CVVALERDAEVLDDPLDVSVVAGGRVHLHVGGIVYVGHGRFLSRVRLAGQAPAAATTGTPTPIDGLERMPNPDVPSAASIIPSAGQAVTRSPMASLNRRRTNFEADLGTKLDRDRQEVGRFGNVLASTGWPKW